MTNRDCLATNLSNISFTSILQYLYFLCRHSTDLVVLLVLRELGLDSDPPLHGVGEDEAGDQDQHRHRPAHEDDHQGRDLLPVPVLALRVRDHWTRRYLLKTNSLISLFCITFLSTYHGQRAGRQVLLATFSLLIGSIADHIELLIRRQLGDGEHHVAVRVPGGGGVDDGRDVGEHGPGRARGAQLEVQLLGEAAVVSGGAGEAAET